MSLGKVSSSSGIMKAATFWDYSDGTVEEKLNAFFANNPNVEIIQVTYGNIENGGQYGSESALVIYRVDNSVWG